MLAQFFLQSCEILHRSLSETVLLTTALEQLLETFAGKWTLLILRELFTSDSGVKRFGELRRELHSISPKTLTDRLRALEAQGIVSRTIYSEVPLHVEYRLTERGQILGPIFETMEAWVRSETPTHVEEQ